MRNTDRLLVNNKGIVSKKNPNGNPEGNPRKFKSVEQMQNKIDEYFKKAKERKVPFVTKDGVCVEIASPAPIHITGMCVHLNLSNNRLNEYQKLEQFRETITSAKKKCEEYAVNCLFEGQKGNKADFVLKNNFKETWKDKFETDITTKGEKIEGNVINISLDDRIEQLQIIKED